MVRGDRLGVWGLFSASGRNPSHCRWGAGRGEVSPAPWGPRCFQAQRKKQCRPMVLPVKAPLLNRSAPGPRCQRRTPAEEAQALQGDPTRLQAGQATCPRVVAGCPLCPLRSALCPCCPSTECPLMSSSLSRRLRETEGTRLEQVVLLLRICDVVCTQDF